LIIAGADGSFFERHDDANESWYAGGHCDRSAQTQEWASLDVDERGSNRFFDMGQASYGVALSAFHGVAQGR